MPRPELKPKDIVVQSSLKDGDRSYSLQIASASKAHRQQLIKGEKSAEDVQIAAAIEIQRVFRGHCTRCRLLGTVDPQISHTALYGASKHSLARLQDVRSPSPKKAQPGQSKIQQRYTKYLNQNKHQLAGKSRRPVLSFEEYCATVIQQWWRRLVNPQALVQTSTVTKPETQRHIAGLSRDDVATIIQRAWRRHIDVQVFRYYRDLINFRQRGDPALMLRCINPNEAHFLDSAAGIHIKFRLAGEKFPPNIYYKVYTHRPVQDLCANSPKDYTRPEAKRKAARDLHHHGDRAQPQKKKDGWYARFENNGWRLVSDRIIHQVMADPVTYATSRKKINFHHDKLTRKQDVEKKKKKRKIEWMQKMYKQGMLKARVADAETVGLIEGAAAGMVATVEARGTDAVQDWEVDELLDWTTSLNFDDYWTGWKEIATSGLSEKNVEDRQRLMASGPDPYELHMDSRQRETSTRPSHNTPVSTQSTNSANYRY